MRILIFAIMIIFLYFNTAYALRPWLIFNEKSADSVNTQRQSLKNIELLARKLPKEKVPDFVLSDGKTEILLSSHPDSNEVFRVYIKESGKWEKIRPLIQDTMINDANIEIDISRGYVKLNALDLGKFPPKGVAKLIFHWVSYMAKAKNCELELGLTQNPRILTLLSQVTDFVFDVKFLDSRKFLVGKPGTPISITYKEGEYTGRGFMDRTSDGYVVEVNGDYETWFPEYEEGYSRDFEGWRVHRRSTYATKWYSPNSLMIKKNGIVAYRGKVIGQILAFPDSVRAYGNPMPGKGGFISVTIPDKVGVINEVGRILHGQNTVNMGL
ncbi:MAG: hypothetical protein WC312_08025 [Candidatus Omnitrophota bacterium]